MIDAAQDSRAPGTAPRSSANDPRPATNDPRRPAHGAHTPGAVTDMPAPGSVQRGRAAERTEVGLPPVPEPGGRRRAPTGTFPPVTPDDTGGRRRRAEGAPTWHETLGPEDTGSHTTGKSVSELLAAHGTAPTPRRHRRRTDD
ncbi:hypothetical protein [Actinokineospora inagensis]|uniref:hypothetical protein n=1 Tax=Actinokineospora inagensis TaxID=103730 RepID=UPI0003F849C5|nr:hypothetical protein [Actinokineospora inagensis]